MTEKRFYRLALEGSLLDGKNVKQQIDAKIAVAERSAASRSARSNAEWNPRPIPLIAIPVTVLLVLCTLTVAAFGGFAGRNGSRSAAGESTPTAQPAEAPAPPVIENEPCSVKLLSEFDAELKQECLDWRASQTRESYDESKWTWLRESKLEAVEVYDCGGMLHWRIAFTATNLQPFLEDDMDRRLDFTMWRVWYSVEGSDAEYSLGDLYNSLGYRFDETQGTLYEGWYASGAKQPLPTTGKITVTMQYCIVDCSVEDMGRYFGSIAVVEQSFTFDAAALQNDPTTEHRLIPLSGSYTFTMPNADRTVYQNRTLSLDGVMLDASIRHTDTDVRVWFTVKEAPESWTTDEKQAVLVSLLTGWHKGGAAVTYQFGFGDAVAVGIHQSPLLWTENPTTPEMWIQIEGSDADTVQLNLNANRIASVKVFGKAFEEGWTTELLTGESTSVYWTSTPLATLTIPLQ